jgi:hypothetical protein
MVEYLVTFFKNVLSSDGHLFKAPQEAVTLRAGAPGEAVRKAKNAFIDLRRIPDWRLHADTFEVAAIMPGKMRPARQQQHARFTS